MWMTITIFVPEVVLFCAWEQWWTTRQLREEVNELGSVAFNGSGAKLVSYCNLVFLKPSLI